MNFLTPVTACIAYPAAENPTIVMMEAAYKAMNLPWHYLTLEVPPEKLADTVTGARAMGFRGFNCSLPHKIEVIRHLDGLGDSARLIGAVNCIVRREDLLIGENTDGQGFVESLRTLADPRGLRAVILGAGGAARAIAVELALAGAVEITIVNRTTAKAAELAAHVQSATGVSSHAAAWTGDYAVPAECGVLVQATSIGLYPDIDARVALAEDSLRPGLIVADVIPNPPETRLLREAASRGCRVLDGLGMLVNQGVLGIRHWTGLEPDPRIMRTALEEVFRTSQGD